MKLKLLVISFLFFLQTKAQIDTIPPVITMLGSDTVFHPVFANYTDAGATAYDLKDGNVSVTKSGVVDIMHIGQYLLTYTAHDTAGNQAIPKRRIVIVRDTTRPNITIIGPNPFYWCLGFTGAFIEPGYTVSDNYDSSLTVAMISTLDIFRYGTYKISYIVYDQSGNSNSASRTIVVTGNCAYGQAFFDKNKNCNFDSLEKTSHQFKLQFKHIATSTTTTVFPDSSGKYGIASNLDTGNYLVKVVPLKNYLILTCLIDSFNYLHTTTSTYVKNIPFYDTLFNDLSVHNYSPLNHRWNFNNSLGMYIKNEGTKNATLVKVELLIPTGVTLLTSNLTYDSISSKKVYWHFDSILANNLKVINCTYKADTSMFHLNDSIYFTLKTFSFADIDTSNNILTLLKRVVGSYDPNDKTCLQPTILKPGVTDFNYTVRFQNTGNAEAFDVVVTDTIDARFDINSLQVTEGSHRYRVFIKNNILSVRFEEIYLPDSHTNEPQSHGFFSYSLKLKKPLSLNEEIKNTAYIYFDNNPAIITNTTLNKYVLSGINNGIDNNLGMYPNPANSIVRFQNPNHEFASLIDMLGHEVLNTKHAYFDISQLPPGIYILKVGQKVGKLIKE